MVRWREEHQSCQKEKKEEEEKRDKVESSEALVTEASDTAGRWESETLETWTRMDKTCYFLNRTEPRIGHFDPSS